MDDRHAHGETSTAFAHTHTHAHTQTQIKAVQVEKVWFFLIPLFQRRVSSLNYNQIKEASSLSFPMSAPLTVWITDRVCAAACLQNSRDKKKTTLMAETRERGDVELW